MTGEWADGPELDAGYWYANLRRTVRFDKAVRRWPRTGTHLHRGLTAPGAGGSDHRDDRDAGNGQAPVICGTLHREGGAAARLLAALGQVFVTGTPVDWKRVLPAAGRVDLPTYAFQRQRYWPAAYRPTSPADGGTGSIAGSWRYQVSWVPVPDPDPLPLAGTWLLVVPAGHEELADACVQALAGRGAHVRTVPAEAARAALAARLEAGLAGIQPAGVVSLLALDETPDLAAPVVPAGLAGTLALVQALGDARITAPLWVLTQGAVATGAEPLASPVQAQAWGLGLAAGAEHPDRWGGLIDLPAVLDPATAGSARCWPARRGPGRDPPGRDHRPAADPRSASRPRQPVDPGRHRAHHRRDRRAGRARGPLGRWPPRPPHRPHQPLRVGRGRRGGAGRRLAGRGTEVDVIAVDVSARVPAAALLTRITAAGPPLRSVFHAAGVLDDGVLDG